MKRATFRNSARRGTIIVIVVVLLLVTMSIAAAVLRAAMIDSRQLIVDRQAMQADRLAEAGIARAAIQLAEDESYDGEDWNPAMPGDETAAVSIRVEKADGRRTVVAVATYPAGSERPVRSRRSFISEQPNR